MFFNKLVTTIVFLLFQPTQPISNMATDLCAWLYASAMYYDATLPLEVNNNSSGQDLPRENTSKLPLTEGEESTAYMDFQNLTREIIVPVICAFGIVGNSLSLAVFCRRLYQGPDTMERSATYGLVTLAACDLLFCILTVAGAFFEERLFYRGRDVAFYFQMYGACFSSMLTRASIWLTVVIGVERYAIVCHPIKARQYMKFLYTKLALVFSMVFCVILYIPLVWEKNAVHMRCGSDDFYFIEFGKLYSDYVMRISCIYTWILLGLLVPLCILAYCNICLIRALRRSWQSTIRARQHNFQDTQRSRSHSFQRQDSGSQEDGDSHAMKLLSKSPDTQKRLKSCQKKQKESAKSERSGSAGRRITIILVLVIAMLFLLLFPSECVQFYIMAVPSAQQGSGNSKTNALIAVCFTNILQACHFSINFILYCVIHQYFRKTIASCVRRVLRRKNPRKAAERSNSCSTTRTTRINSQRL